MKIKQLLSILLLAFITLGCGDDTTEITPLDELTSDDYRIYDLYVDEYLTGEVVLVQASNSAYSRFFWDEGSSGRRIQNLYRSNPDMDWDMLVDFQDVVLDSVGFETRFSSDRVSIITPEELDVIFDADKLDSELWQDFRDIYGEDSQLYGFSRIAFNEGRTQAVFSTGSWNGTLGQGFFVFAVYDGGTWRIEEVFPVWIT